MKSMFILLIWIFSSFAFADVKPDTPLSVGDSFVRVKILKNDNRRFEVCTVIENNKMKCPRIGKASYSFERLRLQWAIEISQSGLAIDADLTMAGVIIVGGLATIVGSNFLIPGLLAAGSSARALVHFSDSINPVEQFKQASTLTENVINDVDLTISSTEIGLFIQRLRLVLSKI